MTLSVTVSTINVSSVNKGMVGFLAKDKASLLVSGKAFDKSAQGILTAAIKNSTFTGKHKQILTVATPLFTTSHAFVVGFGNVKERTVSDWRDFGLKIFKQANAENPNAALTLVLDHGSAGDHTALIEGLHQAHYTFNQFKTKEKDKKRLGKIVIQTAHHSALKKQLPSITGLMNGQALARDLVNLPPNIANPDLMVKEAGKLKKMGIKLKILGEKEMTKLGMNLLLAVGRASTQESRLIVMEYTGDKTTKEAKCVVGKGVMFDTGGYSLKPSAVMPPMKGDMAGAAAVMGVMHALAVRKPKVNVIGVVGCVINMISGDGFLPSDILTGYDGTTVEIGNTDAEGRLVLADAISYIKDTKNPSEIIDLATLTGACMAALGAHYAGLFSNNDKLADSLIKAGQNAGEPLWRLPIDDGYAAKTTVADLSNNGARYGGASTAAVFLKHFVGETPWAHLDIAGVGLGDKIPGGPDIDGASGFGVRVVVDYLENQ